MAGSRRRDVEPGVRQSRARRGDVRDAVGEPGKAVGGGGRSRRLERAGDLERHSAESEEQDSQAAALEAPIEREAQAERVAIQPTCRLEIVARHHDVIERVKRRRERLRRRRERQRSLGREMLDRKHDQAARRRRGQERAAPAPHRSARRLAPFTVGRLARLDSARAQTCDEGRGVGCREGERRQAFPLARELIAERATQRALARWSEKLDITVLQPEERVRSASARMNSPPGGRAPEHPRISLRSGIEIAHPDHDVIDGIEHRRKHATCPAGARTSRAW